MEEKDKKIENTEVEEAKETEETTSDDSEKTSNKKTTTKKTEKKDNKMQKPAGRRNSKKGGSTNKTSEVELAKKQEQLDEATDKYKRLMAEFENARKRNEKEASRMYDVGAKEVLEKLLPIVDNFERALQSVPEELKNDAFEQGIEAIYRQLMTAFDQVGVKAMDAAGKEFNPDFHNAVMHIEDDSFGENIVAEELQKGYMYKDSVLRHSMVKVAN